MRDWERIFRARDVDQLVASLEQCHSNVELPAQLGGARRVPLRVRRVAAVVNVERVRLPRRPAERAA